MLANGVGEGPRPPKWKGQVFPFPPPAARCGGHRGDLDGQAPTVEPLQPTYAQKETLVTFKPLAIVFEQIHLCPNEQVLLEQLSLVWRETQQTRGPQRTLCLKDN